MLISQRPKPNPKHNYKVKQRELSNANKQLDFYESEIDRL